MSLINISFDTKEKTCNVTMNGISIDNVSSVFIDKYEDESHIEISTVERDKDDGTVKVTRVMASEDVKHEYKGKIEVESLEGEDRETRLKAGAFSLFKTFLQK